jgi:hypothetical protein
MNAEVATPRVFISSSVAQKNLAVRTRDALMDAGIETVAIDGTAVGGALQRSLMQAIASSDAVVIVMPEVLPFAAMVAIEVGAAQAWGKPVFGVTEHAGHVELPGYLPADHVFPIARLDDLVSRIQKSAASFSDEERAALVELYQSMGIATDELLLTPLKLDELAARFHERCGQQRSAERLLRELLALRKRGRLPNLGGRGAARAARRGA